MFFKKWKRSSATEAPTKPATDAVSQVALTINGEPRQLELDPRTSWLDALREHLHLTGYCTPGQICSAIGTFSEVKAGCPDTRPRMSRRTVLPSLTPKSVSA